MNWQGAFFNFCFLEQARSTNTAYMVFDELKKKLNPLLNQQNTLMSEDLNL
tara:strand:- start:207 stop:359 length:153 start_codon:yes stop_codon:yes gene_type:complete